MNFWHYHGWLFLFGAAFFPRITTLFFATVSFGFWAIVGWVLTPHLLVAIYATTFYWHTNPILCVVAWIFAFGGTTTEARVARRIAS